MKFKYIYIIFFYLLYGTIFCVSGQNSKAKSDDISRIVINPYVSTQVEKLPVQAKRLLVNKLKQVALKNGVSGSSLSSRFIITPNITILTKDITATAPPMTALTLEISFYIGDGIDGKLFASTSIEVKGVGTNETKAYISAIKRINPSNSDLKDLVDIGKAKIIDYYNNNCDLFIKEAKALESRQKYDEAIFKLVSVPQACGECYEKCLNVVEPIYQKQIDHECKINLAKAKNVWSIAQDYDAAVEASQYLEEINPNAACFKEAEKLTDQISSRIKEVNKQNWEFELKQQQNEMNKQMALINAVKEIGVAYGNNQPKSVTYHTHSWW